jgi:membrane-bound serine protease (ClpP class)
MPDRASVRRLLRLLAIVTAAAQLAAQTDSSRPAPPTPAGTPLVVVAEVDAIIHPVSAGYITSAIARADSAGASLVVIVLRTPGGLVDSTREIVSKMIAARTPVAVFVAPSGARAASAGFILTIAADIAAMAPGTAIGAAHPVSGDGTSGDETMAKKAASDVAAYVRSLADKRGRNVTLAEQAVLESRAFTDQEALAAKPPLIDLVAPDLAQLLDRLDGREVVHFDGRKTTLRTANARIDRVEMTWRERILSAVAHPQVAYLLFSLGTLGLTIELWNPGSILPGVVGGICLLLAFFAFQILPVNYAGLLLILFGLVLLILEIKVTSFGLLAVGGLLSLIFGSLMLFDSSLPELQIGLRFVLPLVLGFSAVVLFLVRLAVDAQRRRATTGIQGMIGERGRAMTAIGPGLSGRVAAHGEIWQAVSSHPVAAGDEIEVLAVEGLKLHVRAAGAAAKEPRDD